jgi:hypothetical protein
LAIVLDEYDEDRHAWLSSEIRYQQLDYPIYLPNAEGIRLTVEQSADGSRNPFRRLWLGAWIATGKGKDQW